MIARMSFYGRIAQTGIEATYITSLTSIANLGFKIWTTGYLFIADYFENYDTFIMFAGWAFAIVMAIYYKPIFQRFFKSEKKRMGNRNKC
mmetsp:Transcript_1569/g.232  ORF Transcript_1569/g.232 Transcript_1569/m.232 type:complete len:90 (+) Transcript_1569:103-372(+)